MGMGSEKYCRVVAVQNYAKHKLSFDQPSFTGYYQNMIQNSAFTAHEFSYKMSFLTKSVNQ